MMMMIALLTDNSSEIYYATGDCCISINMILLIFNLLNFDILNHETLFLGIIFQQENAFNKREENTLANKS